MTKKRTAAKSNGWHGIPKEERRNVRLVMAVRAEEGKKVKPREVYESIQRARYDKAVEAAKNENKRLADDKRRRIAQAREDIPKALTTLLDIHGLLSMIERGNSELGAEAYATFARAALNEAGKELEQAVFDLGVLDLGEPDECDKCGWFVDRFPGTAKPAKGEQKAGAQ